MKNEKLKKDFERIIYLFGGVNNISYIAPFSSEFDPGYKGHILVIDDNKVKKNTTICSASRKTIVVLNTDKK